MMDSSAHSSIFKPVPETADLPSAAHSAFCPGQTPQPSPEPIASDDYRDGLTGLSGFQLYESVTQHLRHHRYSAALLTLAAGAAADRQMGWFWHVQGEALANLGRYSDALISFERAVELTPDRADSLVFQSVCCIHLQRYAQALGLCDRALEFAPYHTQAWLFRGVAQQRLGQYTAAYRSYEQALPTSRSTHISLSLRLEQRLKPLLHQLTEVCRRWRS